jgi:predicted lysophospholipase L1 biosynthesis ABC-type transport system permease subunit
MFSRTHHASGPRLVPSACPRCGSAEIRRLSLIHAAGLPTNEDLKPQHEAVLSKQAAPPTRKPAVIWAGAILIFVTAAILARAVSGAVMTAALLDVAVAIGFAVRAATYNTLVYPRLYEQWERSSRCDRCGNVFVG